MTKILVIILASLGTWEVFDFLVPPLRDVGPNLWWIVPAVSAMILWIVWKIDNDWLSRGYIWLVAILANRRIQRCIRFVYILCTRKEKTIWSYGWQVAAAITVALVLFCFRDIKEEKK